MPQRPVFSVSTASRIIRSQVAKLGASILAVRTRNGKLASAIGLRLWWNLFTNTPFVGKPSTPNIASSESTDASSRPAIGSCGGGSGLASGCAGGLGVGWMRSGTPRINTNTRILFSTGSFTPFESSRRTHQARKSN